MFHIIFIIEFQKGRVFMKNILLKRKILTIFLIILTLTLLIFLRPSIAEKAETEELKELKMIMNMNNDVVPETYNFDIRERPEGEIDNIRIEYVLLENETEEAKIFLPDASKAYSINVSTDKTCHIIMDYSEYTATATIEMRIKPPPYKTYLSPRSAVISFFPSGEIRLSNDMKIYEKEIRFNVSFERKSMGDSKYRKIMFSCYAYDFKLFPYKNGIIINDCPKSVYFELYVFPGGKEPYDDHFIYNSPSDRLSIDKKEEIKTVWVTLNERDYPIALVDEDNDGIFDIDVAGVINR